MWATMEGMYCLSGTDRPWLRRLDHLICEVPDIEDAFERFVDLGFPVAWPIGRFWPSGRTAGVALGGINLEFLQSDMGAPEVACIQTLVFEPVELEIAAARLGELGVPMRLAEKREGNSELLRLRGFTDREAEVEQLICRNAYPEGEIPIDFFLCEYVPPLYKRLGPQMFPALAPLVEVEISTPNPATDWMQINALFGLPEAKRGVELVLSEEPGERAEVTAIRSDRGPIDLEGWPSRFQFV